MEQFEGKIAVITGAGSGIGRGIAQVLAGAGMRVVAADIELAAAEETVALLKAAGADAIAVHTDVSERDSVERLAKESFERFGAVHVLCNNAGVMAWQHAAEAVHADWEWVIGINLWGVIHGIEAFLPRLIARGEEAHIVNTASIAGVLPSAVSSLYSTTKFAVVGLSETLAQELAGTAIGVSVLCPGAVATRIGDSDRNRPGVFRPRTEIPRRAGLGANAAALQPEEVGRMVLEGIRRKQLHIFTEPSLKERVQQRFSATLADFDALAARDA